MKAILLLALLAGCRRDSFLEPPTDCPPDKLVWNSGDTVLTTVGKVRNYNLGCKVEP